MLALLGISLSPAALAKDFADAFLSSVLSLFGAGAAALVTALLGFVQSTSEPVLSGGWWSTAGQAVFDRVSAVGASLLALTFMCSVISAVLSGDHGLLARAAKRLPLAVLETALLVAVTGALVSACNEASVEIATGATNQLSSFVAVSMASAISGTGVIGLACGALVVLAGLCLWAELLCRTALIYLAVMAGPLIFAASVHPSLLGLRRRYLEGSVALICSKVVVALAFATGSALLSSSGDLTSFSGQVGALLEAVTILLIACFAPFVLFRLVLSAESIVAAEGLARRPVRAAERAVGTTTSLGGLARLSSGLGAPAGGGGEQGGSARGGAGGTPGGSPPSPTPSRAGAGAAARRAPSAPEHETPGRVRSLPAPGGPDERR